MTYQTNKAHDALTTAHRYMEGVLQGCTHELCPTFHVYGGDCGHVAECESILEAHEANWCDASAMVWAREKALNPGNQNAHVLSYDEHHGICF